MWVWVWQAHPLYDSDRLNVFVCDVTSGDLLANVAPQSVDTCTMVRGGKTLCCVETLWNELRHHVLLLYTKNMENGKYAFLLLPSMVDAWTQQVYLRMCQPHFPLIFLHLKTIAAIFLCLILIIVFHIPTSFTIFD